MASMERMRQQPHSYEELVLNQYRNDKKAGRKNDFLLKSKKAREILAQWIDGNDNVSHEGRTLPGDAELENSSREADGGVKEDTSGTRELGGDRRADSSGVLISRADKSEQERLIRENAKEKRQMETKYYALPQGSLNLTISENPGRVNSDLIIDNLERMILNQAEEDESEMTWQQAHRLADALYWENADRLIELAQNGDNMDSLDVYPDNGENLVEITPDWLSKEEIEEILATPMDEWWSATVPVHWRDETW